VKGVWTMSKAEIEHARGSEALRLSPNPVTLIDSRPGCAHPPPEEGGSVATPSSTHSPLPHLFIIYHQIQISSRCMIVPKESNACVLR
jgi:hypothetical protein